MSAGAPPEPGLAGAREELARRGYLSAGGEPGRSRLRTALWLVGLAALGSLVLAVGQVSAARAEPALVLALSAGYLPIFAAIAALGAVAGVAVARGLLRLGGEPEVLAAALATAAGLTIAAGFAAALTGTAARPAQLVPGLGWGMAFAVAVAVIARRALEARLAYRLAAGRHHPSAWLAPSAVLLGALASLAWAARPWPQPGEADAAFPPPSGRLAVIAIDGLSREELEAAERLPGGSALADAGAWGWAELHGPGRRLPAVAWTTVACGVEPAVHGVVELEEVRLFGGRRGVPLSPAARTALLACWRPFHAVEAVARPALTRRAPAFWEMASRAGCPVTVGGWWGSWPVRRLLGEVASERAWLAGDTSPDAASPALAGVVRAAWDAGGTTAAVTDRLAVAMAGRAPDSGTHLVVLSLPALDLEQRRREQAPPLLRLTALPAHLGAIAEVLAVLRARGYAVWVVGMPWQGGTPFVAASTAPSGRLAPLSPLQLAATWLDQLGLPAPAGSPPPRRSLSARHGVAATAAYGPPPPPLAAPPPEALATQREVLRSLGYLQ